MNVFPEISAEWLLTGRGEMLKGSGGANVSGADHSGASSVNTYMLRTDRPVESQQVPLYDIEAVAGLVPLFTSHSNPIDHLSIPNLPKCDGAVFVRGDSMYPLLKAGDIVLYKQVNNFSDIIWGEMYLVSFDYDGDEFITVKYINKVKEDPGKVLLVSYNTHHAPKEIPLDCIRAMALVKASVRFNTM